MKKMKMTVSDKVTFEEGCNKYLDNCRQRNLREGTINHYKQSYTQFYKYFDANMPVENFTSDMYKQYVVFLRNTLQNDVSMTALELIPQSQCLSIMKKTLSRATCTTAGSKSYHCSRCDDKIEVTEIDAIGHNYDHKLTAPTCTEQGYTTHTCANCASSYVDSYVDAFGHTYDNDVDSTCNVCDEVRQVATEQTTAQTTATENTAQTTVNTSGSDKKASGCGSSISSGSVLTILLIGCVACVSVKKKKQ